MINFLGPNHWESPVCSTYHGGRLRLRTVLYCTQVTMGGPHSFLFRFSFEINFRATVVDQGRR